MTEDELEELEPTADIANDTTPATFHTKGSSLVHSGRPVWQIVLMLAWPVLMQQFLIMTLQLSDRYLAGNYQAVSKEEQLEAAGHKLLAIGQFANPTASSAATVVTSLPGWQAGELIMSRQAAIQAAQTNAFYFGWFISSATILVTVGSTALVARSVGAMDMASAIHFTNQSIFLAIIFGTIGSILGLSLIDEMAWLLALEGESAEFFVAYLTPMFLLLVFQILELAGLACLVGAGDTRMNLWVMAGVAVINVPVSWGLCLGLGPLPRMGFVGIALGTAIAHMLGGIVVISSLIAGRYGLHLRWHLLWPNFSLIRRLLRVSIPAGVDSLSVVMGQFWFLSIINRLGPVAGSAHGIAIGWEALGFLSGNAFGIAAMTLVGQNLGAKKPEQASHSGWVAFGIGCLIMTVMGAIFYTLARPMFELFCPHPWQRDIVEAGVPVLQLVAFAMPPLASAIIFTNALRGAGDTAFPVLFTWIGFLLVRIPLAYWFSMAELNLGPLGSITGWNLGLFGAWLAMFADLVLRGGLFMYRFKHGGWKNIKV